jgi:OmcA/MtrC family decaheme c-type cytochrome
MQSRSAVSLVVVIGAALGLQACVPAVKVGDEVIAPVAAAGVYAITITGASVVPVTSGNVLTDRVVVLYRVTGDGSPATSNQLAAAGVVPTFTVAALSKDPVSGLDAWKSLLRTGSQSLTSNPIAGPGTPLANLDTGKQPGSERTGTFEDLGGGDFRYTFLNGLTASGQFAYDPAETMRVGCYLTGAPVSDQSATTYDFVPSGATPPRVRDTVLDANCNGCHGRLVAHGVRHGVRLCLTCHTVQNADPDTVDPAAMALPPFAGVNATTNPNPLDLGRLVHRIHRGKNLPTLYVASNNTLPAPPLPWPAASNALLPFLPGRNLPLLGQRYSIVGFRSTELVVGKVVSRTDNDQPARTVAEGIGFPRDLRDCAVCHANAPQADEQATAISRRTCGSCHADVWYGAGNTDAVHFAHLGGPQADDTRCAACHLATGSPVPPEKLYADTRDVHVPIHLSSRYVKPQVNIVQVNALMPGMRPTVVFRASDVNGDIVPLNSNALAGASPVPRGLTGVTIVISGPASDAVSKNFAVANALPAAEPVPLTLVADASGQYSYLFGNALPADATGTWAVGVEGSRRQTVAAAVHYDPVTNTFPWPYTGERVRETAENGVQYVDTATGSMWTGSPVPRRQVVALDRCNQCHGQLVAHGARHQPDYCVLCHAADRTDWSRRPKRTDKNVNLAVPYGNVLGTYDNREERALHLKVLVHRLHTGEATGVVGLQAAAPHLIYGSPVFLDDVRFPNALSNCLLCHVDGTHLIESIPATAPATVANETASIVHSATALHPSSEARIGPVQSACMTCHDTGPGRSHAASHTIGGVEGCATCHGGSSGPLSVPGAHGLVP